ncbi:hypothetical protein Pden_4568 (plasmid) [Paracoccus denitrificans PD1222]|uniref:Uncharacterized protein n=1 Tax=Paracoccus denitrificans (strain Pd 1222) TaxID=318586 RepID=A1BAT7_PARDP|nr:hypothetical protein Pden_4568 [Paracoccus denitrificans PD1222]
MLMYTEMAPVARGALRVCCCTGSTAPGRLSRIPEIGLNRSACPAGLMAYGGSAASPQSSCSGHVIQVWEARTRLMALIPVPVHRSGGRAHPDSCRCKGCCGECCLARGWCHGRRHKANAQKDWHMCESGSDRFTLDHLTDF